MKAKQRDIKIENKIMKLINTKDDKNLCYLINEIYLSSTRDLSVFNACPRITYMFGTDKDFIIIEEMVHNKLWSSLKHLLKCDFRLSYLNFDFPRNEDEEYILSLATYINLCTASLAHCNLELHSFIASKENREKMEVQLYSTLCEYPEIFAKSSIGPFKALEKAIFNFLNLYSNIFGDSTLISFVVEKIDTSKDLHFNIIKNNQLILLNESIQDDPRLFEYICRDILARESSHNICLGDYVIEDDAHKFKEPSLEILNKFLPLSTGYASKKTKTIIRNETTTTSANYKRYSTDEEDYYTVYFPRDGEITLELNGFFVKLNLNTASCAFDEKNNRFIFKINNEEITVFKHYFRNEDAMNKFRTEIMAILKGETSSLKIKIQ